MVKVELESGDSSKVLNPIASKQDKTSAALTSNKPAQ